MYCPSCGTEINVELKYCNRCGANLALPTMNAPMMLAPVKLTVPSIVIGLTILGGLAIIFGSAAGLAMNGLSSTAIVWIVLFTAATLFGCTGLMILFFAKILSGQRELAPPQEPPRGAFTDRQTMHHLPPRLEPLPSVTENTTRTFSPIYSEPSDRGTR